MTLIDKAEALAPCPFCGGEARKWQDPSHSAAWFIGCDDGDRDCFGSIHWAETEADAIAAWNRRAALPARGVGVKPLVWEEQAGKSYRQANCVLGQYQVSWLAEFECWQLSRPPKQGQPWKDGFSRHSHKDEAKAAAQADYEARILTALAPTDAAQAREAHLREAAAAVRARYMGDNNREDQEVLRCEAAILAMIGERP